MKPEITKIQDLLKQTDVCAVAQGLLGKHLVHEIAGKRVSGIITETEAYAGVNDRASHAHGGRRTKRTDVMYQDAGTIYVFLCYGIHHLFNVVCNAIDIADAVLIRSIEPVEGIDFMLNQRKFSAPKKNLTIGPGNVCKALGINMDQNGKTIGKSPITIEWRDNLSLSKIASGPRIGVAYAQEDAYLPYRFWIKNTNYLS